MTTQPRLLAVVLAGRTTAHAARGVAAALLPPRPLQHLVRVRVRVRLRLRLSSP